MLRLITLSFSMVMLLPVSGSSLTQASSTPPTAANADQPFNIGFVLYTKGKSPGTLDA